jgi:hypothetical protein
VVFRNKADGGKLGLIWGEKIEYGLSAVSLRPCGLLALISVNGEKNEIRGKFGQKNDRSARPWGRRALILVNGSCLVVLYLGHLASALRDSAVYSRK